MARGDWPTLEAGAAEDFPGEGTREAYLGGPGARSRLLLMQALDGAQGPYRRALEKRGPGLHHVALAAPDVEGFVAGLAGSGWLLLPRSLETLRGARTAWLARPGVPALIEVFESGEDDGGGGGEGEGGARAVEGVRLPEPAGRPGLLAALGVPEITPSPDARAWILVRNADWRAL